jgi:hypothetical protein
MIGKPGLHGWRDAKRLVDAAVIQFDAISFLGGTAPHSGHRSGVARRS